MTDQAVEKWLRVPNPEKDWIADETNPGLSTKNTRRRVIDEDYNEPQSGNNYLNNFIIEKKLKWIPYEEFGDVKFLAEGGFAEVHEGIWLKNGTRVALKSLTKENSLEKFFKEWEHHESCLFSYEVVPLFGFTIKDKKYTAVMEYANKGSLFGNLGKIARSDWKEKLYVLYKISTGLNLMHMNDLLHRDLHYGNILINMKKEDVVEKFVFGEDDDVWISDLGFCKSINSLLRGENIYGNTPFIAPEVLRGKGYSKASDVYSFALIMWAMTSGTMPYKGRNDDYNLQLDICSGTRPDIIESNAPECYKTLMKECWDAEPSKRPSANDVNRTIMKWVLRPEKTTKEQVDDIKAFIEADRTSNYNDATEQNNLPAGAFSNVVINTNDGSIRTLSSSSNFSDLYENN